MTKKKDVTRSRINSLVGFLTALKEAEKDLETWFSLNFAGRLRDAQSNDEVTEIHGELCELCGNELPSNWHVKFCLARSRFDKPNV